MNGEDKKSVFFVILIFLLIGLSITLMLMCAEVNGL